MELKVYKYLWDKYHESKINTFAQQGKWNFPIEKDNYLTLNTSLSFYNGKISEVFYWIL